MQQQRKNIYDPPRVLQEASFCLERDFLTGSIVIFMNEGIYTMPLSFEEKDFDTDDFNFKWE